MKKQQNHFKEVIDTTLRDGQQSPYLFDTHKYRFSFEDKKKIVYALAQLGVRKFELFSPVVSDAEGEDFVSLKTFIKKQYPDVQFFAHCRCHPKDVERALDAGFDGLNLFMSTAPQARQHSHGFSLHHLVNKVRTMVEELRKQNPKIYLRFSTEDCFRTDIADVYRVYDEIAEYVNAFGIPDTVGITTPDDVSKRIGAIKNRYPKIDIECHFHNDRGFALINSLVAVRCGASYIDTSIWGMAERSGITSVTGLLFNLFQEDERLCERYNLTYSYQVNALMASILNRDIPNDEPVSLANRTHIAGVHQKAVINSPVAYEAMDLRRFGVKKNQLLLGPLCGSHLIYYYLHAVRGFELSEEQSKKITHVFKYHVEQIDQIHDPESVLMSIVQQFKLAKIQS